MSAPAANPPSSLTSSSSQSSLLASRSSASQLQLSTSSLAPRSASPAAVHSGSPSSDESLSSDWHTDEESPPADAHGGAEAGSVHDSMTDSQFITHEMAAEAAAAVQTSQTALPPAAAASSSSSVSAAPSEDSAAAATTVSAVLGSADPQHTDSSWLSVIKGVQAKDRAEQKDGDHKDGVQAQQAADEVKQAEDEKEEKAAQPSVSVAAAAAAGGTDLSKLADGPDRDVPSVPVAPSPTFYARLSSLLSSFSASPVLPGALLSISLLAVGFCLGRAWQRREYSLSQQRCADAIHSMIAQQQRNASARPARPPTFHPRGHCGGGLANGEVGDATGFWDSTCRLINAIMGEQDKEISRWLGGRLQDGVLTPVMVRYIQ